MTKKLKIGLVLDTSLDPPDGVQQYVIGIGEWLRRQGHAVHYLVGQTEKRELPNIHSLSRNIAVRFNGNRTTIPLPANRRKLKRLLRKEQFDVLHVQTPHSPFMSQRLVLAADRRTAVVGTFHIAASNWLVTAGNWLLGWWLRPSLRRFDRMVSVSPAAADFARRTFHMESSVLPNVFDYSLFSTAKPFSRYRDKTVTILFFGRLMPRKGCRLLLRAAAKLRQETGVPPFRLVICGKGPEEAQLQAIADQHGLGDIVELTGFVSEADKPRYYASADITVFPSKGGESFGIVLLEALAGGHAAVLAGDNPGYRSVMAPRPDLLFDPHDVTALTDLLRKHLTNTHLRQEAAEWGADYTKRFDVGVVGRKLLTVYEQALRKRLRT